MEFVLAVLAVLAVATMMKICTQLMTVNNQLRHLGTQLQTVSSQLDQFTEQQQCTTSAVQTILQWLKQWHSMFAQISTNIEHISVTSQVVATRANQLEWRSFLKFHSQWHNESLLATYSRWQKQQCRAPCPKQTSGLAGGTGHRSVPWTAPVLPVSTPAPARIG